MGSLHCEALDMGSLLSQYCKGIGISDKGSLLQYCGVVGTKWCENVSYEDRVGLRDCGALGKVNWVGPLEEMVSLPI